MLSVAGDKLVAPILKQKHAFIVHASEMPERWAAIQQREAIFRSGTPARTRLPAKKTLGLSTLLPRCRQRPSAGFCGCDQRDPITAGKRTRKRIGA